MLKHLENLEGRIQSIDEHLKPIAQIADFLIESGLLEQLVELLPKLDESQLVQSQKTPLKKESLEPYLNKEQVKDYLGIKETAYYEWIKDGRLKPRGGKGQHKYYLSDIRELMEHRKYRYRG